MTDMRQTNALHRTLGQALEDLRVLRPALEENRIDWILEELRMAKAVLDHKLNMLSDPHVITVADTDPDDTIHQNAISLSLDVNSRMSSAGYIFLQASGFEVDNITADATFWKRIDDDTVYDTNTAMGIALARYYETGTVLRIGADNHLIVSVEEYTLQALVIDVLGPEFNPHFETPAQLDDILRIINRELTRRLGHK